MCQCRQAQQDNAAHGLHVGTSIHLVDVSDSAFFFCAPLNEFPLRHAAYTGQLSGLPHRMGMISIKLDDFSFRRALYTVQTITLTP